MRVLVTTFPGKGHFHPVAPMALQLQASGAEVVTATGPDLVGWVRDCGLTAIPAGLTEELAVERAREAAPSGVPFGSYMFACIAPGPMLAGLRELSAGWRPDLVVHEEAEFAAPLLAASLGVPCVTHSWPAAALPVQARSRAASWLEPLWRENRAGEPRTIGDIYLDCCPEHLQTGDIAVVPNVLRMRPTLFDGPSVRSDLDIGRLPRPLVYVTFGTVPAFARAERLAEVVAAVAPHAASVVVTTGPVSPEAWTPLADNVHVSSYLPQHLVLAHADAMVSHGGAGTVLAGLLYGRPHLVLPQGAPSQQRSADRIADLGAGIGLPVRAQMAPAIGAAINALLTDPGYAAAARLVGEEIDQRPSVAAVVDDLVRRFT